MSRVLEEAKYNQGRVVRMLVDYRDAAIDVNDPRVDDVRDIYDRSVSLYADIVRLQMIVQARNRKAV